MLCYTGHISPQAAFEKLIYDLNSRTIIHIHIFLNNFDKFEASLPSLNYEPVTAYSWLMFGVFGFIAFSC